MLLVAPPRLDDQAQVGVGGELPLQEEGAPLPAGPVDGGPGVAGAQPQVAGGAALHDQLLEGVLGRVGGGGDLLGHDQGDGLPVGGDQVDVPLLLADHAAALADAAVEELVGAHPGAEAARVHGDREGEHRGPRPPCQAQLGGLGGGRGQQLALQVQVAGAGVEAVGGDPGAGLFDPHDQLPVLVPVRTDPHVLVDLVVAGALGRPGGRAGEVLAPGDAAVEDDQLDLPVPGLPVSGGAQLARVEDDAEAAVVVAGGVDDVGELVLGGEPGADGHAHAAVVGGVDGERDHVLLPAPAGPEVADADSAADVQAAVLPADLLGLLADPDVLVEPVHLAGHGSVRVLGLEEGVADVVAEAAPDDGGLLDLHTFGEGGRLQDVGHPPLAHQVVEEAREDVEAA